MFGLDGKVPYIRILGKAKRDPGPIAGLGRRAHGWANTLIVFPEGFSFEQGWRAL